MPLAREQALDRFVFQLDREGENRLHRLTQRPHLVPKVLDPAPLGGRQSDGRPAIELRVVELQVVAGVPPDLEEPADGVVVERVWAGTHERVVLLACAVQLWVPASSGPR